MIDGLEQKINREPHSTRGSGSVRIPEGFRTSKAAEIVEALGQESITAP
jgi:hypothetical protein